MRRTIAGIIVGLMLGAMLAVAPGGPASAGVGCSGNSTNAPDGRVRLVGGDWVGGNGSYANFGVDVTLGFGQVGEAEMQWRNLGPDNLTVRVRLRDLIKQGYAARIFVDGVNVTQKLRDGKTVKFEHLPPGARTSKFLVRLVNKTGTTNQAVVRLTGNYGGNPAPTVQCDALFLHSND